MLRSIPGFALLLLILLVPGRPSLAGGTEFSQSASDLIVNVNTKWIGCQNGGYYPIRFSIRNNGKSRTITLEVKANNSYQKFPTVTKSVTLEQNATINSSLMVPMVSGGNYVNFSVLEDGRPIKDLLHSISLPEVSRHGNVGPGVLIVSDKPEDVELFNKSITQSLVGTSSTHPYSVVEFVQHLKPKELSVNWLAYTGIDLLVIPLQTLADDLSAETRNAIYQWVSSGGNLLIYNVGETVTKSVSLERILDWKNRAFADRQWETLKHKKFVKMTIINIDDPSAHKSEIEDFSTGAPWEMSADRYGIRSLGLGKVVALSQNPFPGTISHWVWLLNHYSSERLLWHSRNGISPRKGNDSFFHFLIPNVGGVPVYSLLLLITFFTVLIGPVNYIYYLKKRRLAMLLITVPIIAFGSSLTLLAYSTVIHGFSVKSRVRSITFLDQKQNHAMSINRVAYFAGMAPSDGLNFEPTTAVYPIWPVQDSFEAGRVDWSESQHLQNGWLRSRTRTQFMTVSQQEQRGRLNLQSTEGSSPEVSNGLEWNIQKLFIVDESGKSWVTEKLKAGAIAKLEPLTNEDRKELRKFFSEHAMELPSGVTETQLSNGLSSSRRYRYSGGHEVPIIYQKSLQEKMISRLIPLGNEKAILKPGSYFAILQQSPDLELGLKKSQQNISIHLLLGFF